MDQRYWDSDCFLGWLEAEADKEELCRQVLEAAEERKVLLVTSALTIAEVLALKGHKPIPAEKRAKVEAFFRQPYISVRNITRHVAEQARVYVWDYGIAPKDALHVATAIDADLKLFNTFDKPLIAKWKQVTKFDLKIELPSWDEPKLPLSGGHAKEKKSKK